MDYRSARAQWSGIAWWVFGTGGNSYSRVSLLLSAILPIMDGVPLRVGAFGLARVRTADEWYGWNSSQRINSSLNWL